MNVFLQNKTSHIISENKKTKTDVEDFNYTDMQ